MNYEETIIRRLEAGTLARHAWTGTDAYGRVTACLLAAIVPECGDEQSASACPASVMPAWLAHLTPWIDDAGSEAEWPRVVRRFAATAKNWGHLTERHEYAIRALCVREAMRHTSDAGALLESERVAVLCERVRDGEERSSLSAEFESALAAASAAAAAAVAEAASEEEAAAASWAAAWAEAAAGAEAATAADRLIDQILTVLETAAVSTVAPVVTTEHERIEQ